MARQDTAQAGQVVTPNDAGVLSDTFGLYVGVAGNLTVDLQKGGTQISFQNVQAGTFLPIQVTRVYNTGTTASNIIALY